jgi:hypothetical protein
MRPEREGEFASGGGVPAAAASAQHYYRSLAQLLVLMARQKLRRGRPRWCAHRLGAHRG